MIGRKSVKGIALWGCFLGLIGIISAITGALTVVLWQVYYGDTSSLEKNSILARINEESAVYYLDGVTRIGAIFDADHRTYIPSSEIPKFLQDALVAAEDQNFYRHRGVDPMAILEAGTEGLLHGGRFRRGGSTLTQQTVKNLMDDWEASFARKFREMVKAMQMERLYSKKEIIEFYLNQFHVAGNGKGIAIASKYYFNKETKDLDLVEGAFIAGSVKGPSKYNPFIKYTKELQEKARQNAFDRKNYVLDRMLDEKMITNEQYQEAKPKPVPFNRGEFRNSEVALLSLIKDMVGKPEILKALGLEDDKDINIAGLKIFTTIDSSLQKAAQLATRRNLSRLETILSPFKPEHADKFKPLRVLVPGDFNYAKVTGIKGKGTEDFEIEVSFGVPFGVIKNDALVRFAKLMDLPIGAAEGHLAFMKELREKVKVGDILFCEIKDYNTESHEATVELQRRPEISGGLVALDRGEVRAVVSGFDTLGFNRAIHAKRQPGSVFKSLTYLAGLQMGWSILDELDNERQVFPYQGRFYYPRPDHTSPYNRVSMIWAGVMSENIASVYLGVNLLNRVSFDQFKELLNSLDLSPYDGESPRDYHYRVARTIGVQLDNRGIQEQQLQNAVEEIKPDLVFAGQQNLLRHLKRTWWGTGYEAEIQALFRNSTESTREETINRIQMLRNNYLRYNRLAAILSSEWQMVKTAVETEGAEKAMLLPAVKTALSHFKVISSDGRMELGFQTVLPEEISNRAGVSFPEQVVAGRSLNLLDVQSIWGKTGSALSGSAGISLLDVFLDGIVNLGTLQKLKQSTEQKYQEVMAREVPYSLNQYYQHHDFRIAVGLTYLKQLGKTLGVESELEPVLSFPLGTNVVTANEVAKIYQSFLSGKSYQFFKNGPVNQVTFIKRIEDRAGNLLYTAEATEKQIIKTEHAWQMREILRKIVTHGTGKRARGELFVNASEKPQEEQGKPRAEGVAPDMTVRIPAFGKTGTTNEFTTAYFAGFLPYPTEFGRPLDVDNSLTIATYVGYDRPKMMRRGRIKVYGGTGALPIWTDFAKEVIRINKYEEKLDKLDLEVVARGEWPMSHDKALTPILVDLPRGIAMRAGGAGDKENFATTNLAKTGESFESEYSVSSLRTTVLMPSDFSNGNFSPRRMFQPVAVPVISKVAVKVTPKPQVAPEPSDTGDPTPTSDESSQGDTNSAVDVGPLPKQVIPEEELKQEPVAPGEAPVAAPQDTKAKEGSDNEKKKGVLDLW